MEKKSEFYRKHEKQLHQLLIQIRGELLEDNIPFWQERILDDQYPGYLNCFDRQGRLEDTRKPGWFVGRTMYMFAALYNQIEPREEWQEIARAGRDFMKGSFYLGDGRFARMMSRDGRVLEGAGSIFTDHFAVKGLYEYIRTCREHEKEQDVAFARLLSDQLFKNVQKPDVLQAEGIEPGWQKHAINFMTLLVALESRAVFGNQYDDILHDCVKKSLYMFANDEYKAPFEYIGTDGKPRLEGEGRLIDAGHTMESLWFSMRAGKECGCAAYIKRAETVLDWVIARCYDEEYGGFYQHVDVDTLIPQQRFLVNDYAGIPAAWDDKIWWVQAEGLNALAMSALYNENEKHFTYFLKLYDYVQNCFRDKEFGEWYSILKRDGSIRSDKKGFELKGPYHVPRCLMQLTVLLEAYLFKMK